ncbi:MAG TPA: cytochrome c3 family protein [Nitrospira sp.]|nr:cytochrome c3 family protein [Nitrospira sp.]
MKARGPTRRLPGASRTKEEIWIDGMVEEAKGKCLFCHILGSPDGASQSAQFKGANSNTQVSESRTLFPTVEKTAIPERWLPFSTFDHKAHSILTCVACHEAAPHSKETKDVLLPSIGSCRNCHFEPGGARAQCLTCHVYHDKSQAKKPGDHLYSIEEFKTGLRTTR